MQSLMLSAVLFIFVSLSNAQKSALFTWEFSGSIETLPLCEPLTVTVLDGTAVEGQMLGVPPFFMNAYAVGQLPQTTFIGDDPDALTWTPNFPAGTDVLLNVVDSDGSSGGTPVQLFIVTAGESTDCIPEAIENPPMDFTISSNVSDTLQTCEPWGLTIKGGEPPYIVSLAALDSPVTTNLTGGTTASTLFTYINRALPGSTLVAGVSDSTGKWAFGTPLVETYGGSDVECNDLGSEFTPATLQEEEEKEEEKASFPSPASTNASPQSTSVASGSGADSDSGSDSRKTALLAGILAPLCLILIFGILAFLWWRRKQKNKSGAGGSTNFQTILPFKSTPSERNLEQGFPREDRSTTYATDTFVSIGPMPSSQMSTDGNSRQNRDNSFDDLESTQASSPISKRRMNMPPNLQPQRQYSESYTSGRTPPPPARSFSEKRRLPDLPSALAPSGSGQQEEIFQHTDSIVRAVASRESLPPPYMNYTGPTVR